MGSVPKTRGVGMRAVMCKKEKKRPVSLEKCLVFYEAGDAMFLSDIRTAAFIDVNKAACRLLGYSRKELVRMKPADIDAPEYARLVPQRMREVLRKGIAVFETVHVTKGGKRVPTEMSVKRVCLDGKPALLAIARDITERKKAEEELRASEHKFKDIAEVISDWIWETDKEGRYTYTSPKVKELLGYRPSDLLGRTPFRFMPKDEAARIKKIFREKALKKQPFYYLENTCCRKDGSLVVLETSGVPLFDEKSRFMGYRGIDRDITARKKVEEEKSRLLHALNERVKELTCLYDLAKVIEKPGITVEELLGRMARRLPAAYQYPAVTCARITFEGKEFKSANCKKTKWKQSADIRALGKKAGAVEVYYVKKRPASYEGPFLKEERQLIDAVAERLGHVVERKSAEAALELSEINYRSIFETSNDGIVVRDIETYKVVDVNKRACEMFLYTKGQMMGRHVTSVSSNVPPYTDKKLVELLGKAARGEPQVFEWLVKDRFGRKFWVEVSLKRSVIGGKYRLISLVRDISERKQLEEMRNDFMNTVSHELRTPLAAIKEGIAIVSEKSAGMESGTRECLDIAKRNVDRLARLISNVLDLQRLEYGKVALEMGPGDINDAINECYRTMLPLARNKGLDLRLQLADILPGVRFDRDAIAGVLGNIVSNAIKFTDKGSITITTSRSDGFVQVSVKDTGIGIKEEDAPKLFQKFEQITKRGGVMTGSAGLGLFISKEMIERHKGRIWAESVFGKGSTFHFTLPAR